MLEELLAAEVLEVRVLHPAIEQSLLAALPPLAWPHLANPPLHQFERKESRLAIRGNPQNPICKKIALQRSKTGKFDYFSTPNQPARSRDSEFCTDDELLPWRPGDMMRPE